MMLRYSPRFNVLHEKVHAESLIAAVVMVLQKEGLLHDRKVTRIANGWINSSVGCPPTEGFCCFTVIV